MKLQEIVVLKGQSQYVTEGRFMSDSELVFILFGVCLFQLVIFHQGNVASIGGEMWRRDHRFGGHITRVRSSDFPPKAV